MTRINAFIKPADLTDKQLIAEHREIKRIPNMINSGKAKIENIPENFTLGKGHVKFFYNKLLYLHKRYQKIYKECKKRGFNVTDYSEAFMINDEQLGLQIINDWDPNPYEKSRIRKLLIQRFIDNKLKTNQK